MGQSKAPAHGLIVAALVIVQILFGLNYVISKVVVDVFPPLVWASTRIIISAAILVFFAVIVRRPYPRGGFKKFYGPLIIFAMLGTVINQGCFLVGLRHTTATNSAVLNTLIPVFTLLIVTIRGQEKLTWYRAFGFLCAFGGVLVLRNIEEFTLSNETFLGDLLTMLNCLSYGFFLAYSKTFMERHDRLWTTAWMFLYGSVGLTLAAIPDYMYFQPPAMTPVLWGCAIFAIVGGTLLTYFLNNWALAYTRSSNVALWIYIQPVFAALLAWAWKGQPITIRTVLSSVLIFAGFVLALEKGGGKALAISAATSAERP